MKYLYALESTPENKSLTGVPAGTPWWDALPAPFSPAVWVLLLVRWCCNTYFPPEGELHSARAKQRHATCKLHHNSLC